MNIPFSLVFLAGGKGTRLGTVKPKQYLEVHNKPLALYSFEVFLSLPELQEIVVVCDSEYEALFQNHTKNLNLKFAQPGIRRQDSVYNGIQKLHDDSLVCIHDSARPFIDATLIRAVVQTADSFDAAVLGVKARSTIKICDDFNQVKQTLNRDSLWEIQTPQVIRANLLKQGFEFAHEHQLTVTDDVSLVELLGKPVKVVEGSYSNIKVTTHEDFMWIEQMIRNYVLL